MGGWAAACRRAQTLFDQRLRYVHGYARPGQVHAPFWALMVYATATETNQGEESITPEQLRYRLTDVAHHYTEHGAVRSWMHIQLQRAGHHIGPLKAYPPEGSPGEIRAKLDHLQKLASGERDDPVVNEWISIASDWGHFGARVHSMVRMLDVGLQATRGGLPLGAMVRTQCRRPFDTTSDSPPYGGRGFVYSPRWRFDHRYRTLADGAPSGYRITEEPTTAVAAVDRQDLIPIHIPEPPENPAETAPDPGWTAALERAEKLVRGSTNIRRAPSWTDQGAMFTVALALSCLARRGGQGVDDVPLNAVLNVLFSTDGLDDLVQAEVGTHHPAWLWLLRWWPRDAVPIDDGLDRIYAPTSPEPALHLCRNAAIRAVERPLLAARSALLRGTRVRVTEGEGEGQSREGEIRAWAWGITERGTLASGPPREYGIDPIGELGRRIQATVSVITVCGGPRGAGITDGE